MTSISTPASRTARPTRSRGAAGPRWALLAALIIGATGGAGVSAALVHSQVRIVHDDRTVYVPVPSDPLPPASGNLQRKV